MAGTDETLSIHNYSQTNHHDCELGKICFSSAGEIDKFIDVGQYPMVKVGAHLPDIETDLFFNGDGWYLRDDWKHFDYFDLVVFRYEEDALMYKMTL